ncbi:hypothetical protein I204_05592 [Kwoniella mangroviensis CBS 8886]|uniref:uncharacterized protein n=1 Tax=Kwoniella mangroviensis CBS 8507 TaxID=1296122 RepID=UPI00080CE242|nr:uncharacterized protein I203_07747 [Kwoniella mangroviensis CBS 8507]OCF63322.1 hypothetical protein I203_07747 [Kwoniella mangroviensis CBS 8507]OCF73748.1 hypothetical protein I204_05592 [Kwoniella mangroviensis CBS 8886]
MSSGMYETTVGSLSLRKLNYSYSNDSSPFTDTLIYQGNQVGSKKPSMEENERSRRSNDSRNGNRGGRREDLESEDELMSVDEEMDELSDSRSSHTSSRPVTPSQQHPITIPTSSRFNQKARSASPSGHHSPEGIFTLAHKAERILGLVPGTLGHAKACLENAKDEIRRLAELDKSSPVQPYLPSDQTQHGQGGLRNRAKKAMSMSFTTNPSQGYGSNGKVPNVVLGLGVNNKEEEERREKRRKAADGVIYWQREIERLEREETERAMR